MCAWAAHLKIDQFLAILRVVLFLLIRVLAAPVDRRNVMTDRRLPAVRDENVYQSRFLILAGIIGIFALTSHARGDNAAPSDKNSWLLGNFTQSAPCKGDGSDPAELKVRIAIDQIESKSGVCKFIDVTPEGNRIKANMECQFPAGPLIGDVTFTQKTSGSIDVADRDNNYTAILYRCPN